MGELGYLMVYFNQINDTISLLNGLSLIQVNSNSAYYSSTEYNRSYTYVLKTLDGLCTYSTKTGVACARPFAIVE